MNRTVLASALLLLAPALSAATESSPSLDVRPRLAEPRDVVIAFADLCILAPDEAAETAAALKLDGKAVTEAPPPGTAPGRFFDLRLGAVDARVGFSDAVCMLDVSAVDGPATVALFDDYLAHVFADWGKADAQDAPPPPPGGKIERDVHLAKPRDGFGLHLTLVSMTQPGRQSGMFMIRGFEQANAQAQAAAHAPPVALAAPPPAPAAIAPGADYAPSEDISSRANFPPDYPEAAIKACAFGVARLRVSIDAQGNVLNVTVANSSRNRDLDRAAIDAARQWRFNPGQLDGQPVGGDVIVPVNFNDPCPRPADPDAAN